VIGEIVGAALIYVVGYGTGRVLLALFHPHIRVPPLSKADTPGRRWNSFTYVENGQRFFHDDSVTFVGVLFWVITIIVVAVALRS